MQFSNRQSASVIALAFLSLLTGVDSTEIDTATTNIESRALCSGTGPGVCNLGVAIFDGTDGLGTFVTSINAFDRYCNSIGFATSWEPGDCFFSQLPYAICIDEMDPVSQTISFRYADQSISSSRGQCYCSSSGGLDCWVNGTPYRGTTCCQCAFNC